MARYGQTFKDRAVARLLPPESAALELVAQEVGIGSGANTSALDGFLGNVSTAVGVLGALQGLRSHDTLTQLGSAGNLLNSANYIAGRLGATASGDPAHADFMTVVKSLRAGGQNIGGSRKVCSRYLLNSCSRPFYLGKMAISYRGSSQRATGKAD